MASTLLGELIPCKDCGIGFFQTRTYKLLCGTCKKLEKQPARGLSISLDDINRLQTSIMQFVDAWVRREKTPVPQKEIILQMKADGIKDFTTVNALNALLRKGYIRRAYTISNKTTYVQLRMVQVRG